MHIDVRTTTLGRLQDDAAILLVPEGGAGIGRTLNSAGRAFRTGYDAITARKGFTGAPGQVLSLPGTKTGRIGMLVLAGIGNPAKATSSGLASAAANAAKTARGLGARSVSVLLPRLRGPAFRADRCAQAVVEGAWLGLYRFDRYKAKPSKQAIETLTVLTTAADRTRAQRGASEGEVLAEATCFARDLSNEPGNTATPTYLAQAASDMVDSHGLSCRVLEEEEMEKLGMGALLGVSRGSREPAKLIMLTYEPKGRRKVDTVCIVGKGLTFDAGGISIKPSAKMEDMKFDMCGGAAVLGAMRAVAGLRVNTRVVALVPASENLPDGDAYKPGDILRASNGTTIEIRNTDAEGRLILADALAYATSKLRPKPKAIVDLATLTGAVVVALGNQHAALVSNNEALAERLLAASTESGDALWRMPINDGYRAQLKSPYADVSNLGSPGAGSLTAAAFLENFTGNVPWAHLDIAGMAWTGRNAGIHQTGGTGFGVRVIARFLQRWSRR